MSNTAYVIIFLVEVILFLTILAFYFYRKKKGRYQTREAIGYIKIREGDIVEFFGHEIKSPFDCLIHSESEVRILRDKRKYSDDLNNQKQPKSRIRADDYFFPVIRDVRIVEYHYYD